MPHIRKSLSAFWAFFGLAILLGCVMPRTVQAQDEVPLISVDEVRAKYQLPASQYADIEGISIHYVDEGEGPAVVLLHASYHSLRTWDEAAARLTEDYRVVRFDFPGAGLSGFDTLPIPEGGYSLTERNLEVMEKLLETLGVERFALVGTSSGGTVAFNFAARHPDKVERLVLINSAGMPRTAQTDPLRERPEFAKWAKMPVRPREFWAAGIGNNFIAPNEPPEWLVDQAADFARKDGLIAHSAAYRYKTGDTEALLAEIEAPTLVMWGKANPTVMHLEADVFEHWLTGAPSLALKYPGLGHYPYVEDLDAIWGDLSAFLAGKLDGKLRQTMRVKIANSPED